ncbi:UNVERIFIED_CONTAM: very-short-patch-repair endonuclease [Williamsia faeni]
MDWSALPTSGITALTGINPTDMAIALDDLPDDAPAVLLIRLDQVTDISQVLGDLVAVLENITYDLYPVWLPGAEVSPGRATIDRAAARALASELAARSDHYRPFLMDLTSNAIAAHTRVEPLSMGDKYSAATRMSGLIRVIATSFDHERVVLALYSPTPLPTEQQRCVAAVSDWLSAYVGVWLLDDITAAVDRFTTVRAMDSPGEALDEAPWTLPAAAFPPISGRPHPASAAEQRLESHLARVPWAADRRWNHLVPTGDLQPFVRADLLLPDARIVVEIDGADHRTATKYSDDRTRDVALQLAGYLVVRFTNEQVLSDTARIADIIEKLRSDRLAAKELP